ncbi:hypothetical protein LCGC14_1014800 [marine sediment metagenome]|uniref:Uncharacterized protein n=1 Tax=marine sediment metagenome TaxID=412755 RepID=A0A0F9NKQ7_9ZZZZ
MTWDSFESFIGVLVLLFFVVSLIAFYDSMYVIPIVDEKANEYCQEQGFDFYEEYSRIGFLSKEPVAIICKYVEQYRNIDLNINEREK